MIADKNNLMPTGARVLQKNLAPGAAILNILSLYDGSTNSLIARKADGTAFFTINFTKGTVTYGVSALSLVKEIQMPLLVGGASSGGVNSFYTSSTTPQYLTMSKFQINPASYPGCTFLLEAVYRAGASGDSARTFTMDLYDVTGGQAVTNSSISGSAQSGVLTVDYPIVRGATNFQPNLTTGLRTYVLRFYSSVGGSFVDLYQARLIIQY